MSEADLKPSEHLFIEQDEIIENINKIREEFRGRGLSWNRIRGDAFTRVVAHYLKKHLANRFCIARLAWVEGCETEFDLLVVDKDAEPIGFTGAYPKEQVHLLIEVKGSGVFYKREKIKEHLYKFEKWKSKTGKPIFYISIWEAKAHIQEVLKALGKENAFIFQFGKDGENPFEWERFLERVNAVLKP